jgi:hypothetical protein
MHSSSISSELLRQGTCLSLNALRRTASPAASEKPDALRAAEPRCCQPVRRFRTRGRPQRRLRAPTRPAALRLPRPPTARTTRKPFRRGGWSGPSVGEARSAHGASRGAAQASAPKCRDAVCPLPVVSGLVTRTRMLRALARPSARDPRHPTDSDSSADDSESDRLGSAARTTTTRIDRPHLHPPDPGACTPTQGWQGRWGARGAGRQKRAPRGGARGAAAKKRGAKMLNLPLQGSIPRVSYVLATVPLNRIDTCKFIIIKF